MTIVAADLYSVERLYWDFTRPATELFATDATIDFLKKLDQPARVITWGLAEHPAARRDPYLAADGLMVHRIRQSLIGYHGNQLGRYNLFAGEPQGYDQVANPTFWALSNSQYLLSNTDQFPMKELTIEVGKVKNAAGTIVTLYKLPGENPLAWVAPAIMKFPDASVLEAVRAPNFPVRSVALFDTSSKVEAVQLAVLPAPLDIKTRVTAYDAGHIALTLSAPAPKGSALVVSENYYPGWRVKIDGKPGNVERADLVLMGVPLPEGAREVELTFTSDSYETGKRVTLAAILLSVLAMLGGAVMDRRQRVGVEPNGATA